MPVINPDAPNGPRAHPNILGRQYLYVFVPPVIFEAQADGDQNYTSPVQYKNGVGDFNDIYRGHTLLVGSTAGARDKGIIRIRAVDDTVNPGVGNEYPGADDTFIYTSEHEVPIDNNDYLTVLDEFRLWHVDPFITDTGNIYKDWNSVDPNGLINFPPPAILGGTDRDCENTYQPVPVMGPHSIEWLTNAIATHNYDWQESWTVNPCVADDDDIDYYAVFPGGAPANSNLSDGAVDLPVGATWVRLWVEDDRGIRCYWGHRLYVSLDPDWIDEEGLYVSFQVSPRQGSVDQGGHSMQFTIQVDAAEDEFPDGAIVIWFFDGGTQEDISGNWEHRSHIHFVGHIKKASTHKEPETGYVSFEAETVQAWMKTLPEFPNFIEDEAETCGNCDNWTEWTEAWDLTVQRAATLHMRWQSSLLEVADVIFIPDADTPIGEQEFPEGELYQQLDALVNRDIRYRIGCDPLCTTYFNKDPQFLTTAPDTVPAGIATIMDIEDEDWRGRIDLPEPLEPQTAYILASGNAYIAPNVFPFFSEAPGPVPLETGSRESQSRIICTTQLNLNVLNGLMLAWKNNDFPDIPVPLDGQYYIGHLFPMEVVGLDLVAADTKRDVNWSAMYFIPRRSQLQVVLDSDGAISHALVDLNIEKLTYGPKGQTLLYPGLPTPEDPPGPPGSPTPPGCLEGNNYAVAIGGNGTWLYTTEDISASPPTWVDRTPPLWAGGGYHSVAVEIDGSGNKVIACGDGGDQSWVHRSLNGGVAWDRLVLPNPVDSCGDTFVNTEVYMETVDFAPYDPDKLYVVAWGRRGALRRTWVYRTTDFTAPAPTWNSFELQVTGSGWQTEIHGSSTFGNLSMAVGPDGSIWVVTVDYLAGYPATQVPRVHRSLNAGVSFTELDPVSITEDVNSEIDHLGVAVSHHDGDRVFVYGRWRNTGTAEVERVRYTDDQGATWYTRETGLPAVNMIYSLQGDPWDRDNYICMVDTSLALYSTINQGANWAVLNAAFDFDTWCLRPFYAGGFLRLCAGDATSVVAEPVRIIYSPDGGVTTQDATGTVAGNSHVYTMAKPNYWQC